MHQQKEFHASLDLEKVAEACIGFVGADLEELVRSTLLECGRLSSSALLQRALLTQPSTARHQFRLLKPTLSLSSLGGLADVKQRLQEAVTWPLQHHARLLRLGVRSSSGLLLYGPPGCSKTSLVLATAAQSHASFLAIDAAQLYSPYVGDAEGTLRSLFRSARQSAPAIVFLDELDAIVGNRDGGDEVQDRVLSTLLNEMDGIEANGQVVVVAATNRIDSIDAALLRPGRLETKLYVGLPEEEARREILLVHSRKMPLSRDVDIGLLARETAGWSGAELQNLCREAGLAAMRRNFLGEVELGDFRRMLAPESLKR